MSSSIFEEIARRCSISEALSITGLSLKDSGGRAVAPPSGSGSFRSPIREDSNPSFSLFRDKSDQHWCFKDHATGDAGNMIIFVKLGLGLSSNGDAAKRIDKVLRLGLFKKPYSKVKEADPNRLKNLERDEFTELHAEQIASVVGIKGSEGIERMLDREILGVGSLFRYGNGNRFTEPSCFFLFDRTTESATARKLNGEQFGKHKSLSPKDWHKRPIGISAIHPTAAYGEVDEAVFCEGEKDLIAVMHGVSHGRSIPICMPSATTTTTPEHAERFANMTCTIYAQADTAGIVAALQWFEWLKPHAFQIRVRVPRKVGDDWADLAAGCTSSEMELLLSDATQFDEYIDEEILTLSPDAFPKEKVDPPVQKKKGGSPRNNINLLRVWVVWELLPEDQRKAADICRALGLEARGAPHAKVTRGLKGVIANLEQLRAGDYSEEAVKAGMAGSLILVQRKRNSDNLSSVTTAPVVCNYSEKVA